MAKYLGNLTWDYSTDIKTETVTVNYPVFCDWTGITLDQLSKMLDISQHAPKIQKQSDPNPTQIVKKIK